MFNFDLQILQAGGDVVLAVSIAEVESTIGLVELPCESARSDGLSTEIKTKIMFNSKRYIKSGNIGHPNQHVQ